jgi:hypothetical protein
MDCRLRRGADCCEGCDAGTDDVVAMPRTQRLR